jgi:hypothetical protein
MHVYIVQMRLMKLQIKLSAEQCPCDYAEILHSSGKVKPCRDGVSISSHGSRIFNYFYLTEHHMLQTNVHF